MDTSFDFLGESEMIGLNSCLRDRSVSAFKFDYWVEFKAGKTFILDSYQTSL